MKRSLDNQTVWAIVVLVLGFMALMAFLINAGRTAELRSMLTLIGQGFGILINLWLINRATKSTNAKVDHVEDKIEEVKQVVNGTPHPGTLPRIQP